MDSYITNERWCQLDYAGGRYEISDWGRLRRWGPVGGQEGWQYMRGSTGTSGTLMYNLGSSMVGAHRLVARYFLNDGKPLLRSQWVRHRNDDHRDNRPENLEVYQGGNPCWDREVVRAEVMAELRAEGWTPPPGQEF